MSVELRCVHDGWQTASGVASGYVPVLHQLDVGKRVAGFDREDAGAVERALGIGGDGRTEEGRDTV